MLAIEMLPGGHGDALVVEYGSGTDVHRVLVDAGTIHAYDAVRSRLLEMPDERYEAVVVTHVDEDHIGGTVPLLDDPDLRHRIDQVWFNGYVHSERGGSVLGPYDGERLTLAIADGGFAWNSPFPDPISDLVGGPIVVPTGGPLPVFDLPGGARLHLLSPSPKKLKSMAGVWEKVITKAGLLPGSGIDGPSRAPRPHEKAVAPMPDVLTETELDELAAESTTDRSEANGSSIAFVLEHDVRRVKHGCESICASCRTTAAVPT
jgi:hypothetical protein